MKLLLTKATGKCAIQEKKISSLIFSCYLYFSSFKHRKDSLESTIRRNKAKALFLDEWEFDPVTKSSVGEEALIRVATLIHVVWIAQETRSYRTKMSLKLVNIAGFTFVDLELNLRNSREIVDAKINRDHMYVYGHLL